MLNWLIESIILWWWVITFVMSPQSTNRIKLFYLLSHFTSIRFGNDCKEWRGKKRIEKWIDATSQKRTKFKFKWRESGANAGTNEPFKLNWDWRRSCCRGSKSNNETNGVSELIWLMERSKASAAAGVALIASFIQQ